MIINSNFKDYYDALSYQYRDEKIVYNRENKTYRLKDKLEFEKFSTKYCCEVDCENRIGVFMICGKLYPFSFIPDIYMFSLNENMIKTFGKYDFKNPYKALDKYKQDHKFLYGFRFSKFQKVTSTDRHDMIIKCQQESAPIILLTTTHVIFNPILRPFHIPIDPYTLVQELSMFLVSKEPHIPQIDNETKIDAAGFDKYSFRKEKRKK